MCYRVVATRGDYMAFDVSGGTGAKARCERPLSWQAESDSAAKAATAADFKTPNFMLPLRGATTQNCGK